MQFIEFCKNRELIDEDLISYFKMNLLSLLNDEITSNSEFSDLAVQLKVIKSPAEFAKLDDKLLKELIHLIYKAFFRYVDRSSEGSSRKVIQPIDEYIAHLDEEGSLAKDISEYFGDKNRDEAEKTLET